ncbi:acyl-CoA carboxylase subunit epsilon [Streptomyces sp. NPDC099050]|uniref:acyl-CoA carboxylase subunit epsilon n=1 Tax=Streptomyces sp. NPDC099050 TaxID=3366100 RepID=UPI0038268367
MSKRRTALPAPHLCVVKGDPTPEEMAAVTAVLLRLAATVPSGPAARPDALAALAPEPSPGWQRTGPHRPAGAWRTYPL